MESVLRISGARKRFGNQLALAGADLVLRAGEWLALLGPNGAGKTTLIRAIMGRVRLDGGQVEAFGQTLDGHPAALRQHLGFVPQDLAIYPKLTARENLRTFGRFQGLSGRALSQRCDWALEWTGLADRAHDRAGGFSGGMKRRLNIACGVLHEPRLVLLDEPTVGVDPQSRERIWEMCAALRRNGASLLLTTHQLDEAQKVCDRIVIIDHGRSIAAGTFGELVRQTVGPSRLVTLRLDQPPGDRLDPTLFEIRDTEAYCRLNDVAGELSTLLTRVRDAGLRVEDVHVEAPSLQAVFLHLTGRELRE